MTAQADGRRRVALIAMSLLALPAAGCTGASRANVSASPTGVPVTGGASHAASHAPSSTAVGHRPTPAPSASGPVAPLTGVAAPLPRALLPAVAVATTVGPGSPAAMGLASADVVFEAGLGHDASRLLAVYQSHDPPLAGPVAGTLPSDAQLLAVLHPVLANTGGSAGFLHTLRVSALVDGSPGRAPYGYAPRAAPVAAFMAIPGLLRRAAGHGASAPPGLFVFNDGAATPHNRSAAATSVVISSPGQLDERWTYDVTSAQWRRKDAGGVSVAVANLVLQFVRYDSVLLHHPGKVTVPVARPLGTGRATVLSGPSSIQATWRKPGEAAVTNYLDAQGSPVWLRRGATWVSLLPAGARLTIR